MTLSVGILVFPGFEILDMAGPVEMLGMHPRHFRVELVAEKAGRLRSAQGPGFLPDTTTGSGRLYDIILVPGGEGTRREVNNPALLRWIRDQSAQAKYVTSVCTGSALLARAAVLEGRRATSNKMNFAWVAGQGPNVAWDFGARWVEDGNIFTSSGVSAGMDMTLGLIARILDAKAAENAALWAEYSWQRDAGTDPFAAVWTWDGQA